ncbi:hypothetical protein FRC04_009922 [Tulasnella sp. 424]|nr:hypothetical protein FRC04_009922 [Tulasnella sp. 424]
MHGVVRDPAPSRSSGGSSPSTSAPTSEAQFSGDADDEFTSSEDMASVEPSDVASDLQGRRAGSPARSDAASVYSYSSSTDNLTRDIYGRTVNNVNDYYMLPADVDEHGRLDRQHEMLKLAMDGIFVKADVAERALTVKGGKTPKVLDVGTGSGSWVLDCAKMFPEAEVVGLDLVPAHLTTYVLRPGGVYQMVEGSLRLYDENRQRIPPQQDNDPARGNGVNAYDQVPGWLEEMGAVWEEVGVRDVWVPIGPWQAKDEKQIIIGEMHRRNILHVVNSFRPLLLSYGYFDETIDK